MALRRFLVISIALWALLSAGTLFADDAVLKDDSRLDQKVTLSADGVTVSSVLDQLSASTGVTMTAGLNVGIENDWSTRDRKVIVQVADMRLGDLMQQLSQILHFNWSKSSVDGKATYRLVQDKQELAEEESLRAAADSARAKETRDKRENALADMVKLGSLSAADTAKLKAADPWRYVLATEPLWRDVASFLSNFPGARNAFVQETEAGFAVAAMPAQVQETVRRIIASYDSLAKSIGSSEDHSTFLAKFDKLQITINQPASVATDAASVVYRSTLGRITIGTGTESFEISLFDPSSPIGKAHGRAIISLKGGASKDDVGKQLESDMASVMVADRSVAAPPGDTSSDAALKVKVKLFDAPVSATLPIVLKSLALNSHMNVVSDYFAGVVPAVHDGVLTLGEQLETIRKLYGTNWTKAGNVLTFRDNEWFNKRTWAVPEVWIKYWTDRGEMNNGLLMDDFVQIGNLRDAQIDHTVMTDRRLVHLGAGEASRNRQILRFYAGLTVDERKQMGEGTLTASSLKDAQWSLLKAALATKGAAYAAVQKAKQTVKFVQSPANANELSYTFAYDPGNGDPVVTFKLTSGIIFAGFEKPKDPTAPATR